MTETEKPPQQYSIELFTKEKIPQAAEAYMLAFNAAGVGEQWDQDSAEEFIKHCQNKQPDLFFIATDGEDVVGGMSGEIRPWWNGPHLAETEIFVHPEHQGKGVAKSLFIKVLEEAIDNYGIKDFEGIADGTKHEFPMKWYEKIGIEKSGWVHVWGNPKEILKKLKE